jgi:flavin reductase (DIM6/NTAB) family NADH-FMN oxidoreductase RutF
MRWRAVDPISPERFRQVLAHVPTPVVVVTASGPDGPAGLAIGSFVSISLDPLLVGFFPAKSSTSWPAIRDAGHFCVNVLADDQTDVSRTFAVRGGDKFAEVAWRRSECTGAPILEGCVVWIDCELDSEIDTGDHVLVLGRVVDLDVPRDQHALVFHRGDYTSTAAAELQEGEG